MERGYAEMARLMGLEPVSLEDFWKKVSWLGWRSMAGLHMLLAPCKVVPLEIAITAYQKT